MNTFPMYAFLSGGLMVVFIVAGLFFLRFWHQTHDRFFSIFATAFVLMGLERIPLALFHQIDETHGWIYLIRLMAFLLILGAIVDKNRTCAKSI